LTTSIASNDMSVLDHLALGDPGREQIAIRGLVSRLEGVALLVQAIWIYITVRADDLDTTGTTILLAAAGAHLAAAAASAWTNGPSARGGPWMAAWIGAAFIVPPLMANLIPYGTYGNTASCVQLCGYPVPLIVMIAFYPWLQSTAILARRLSTLMIMVGVLLMPLAVIAATHDRMRPENWVSWISTILSYIAAFILGQAIAIICKRAIAGITNAYRSAFDYFTQIVHSNVGAALAAARMQQADGDIEGVISTLDRLQRDIRKKRAEGARVFRTTVFVSDIIADAADLHGAWIEHLELPRSGGISVSGRIAVVIELTLGGLLKNAHMYARGSHVKITCEHDLLEVRIGVVDHGRGFDGSGLDQPGTNLNDLRTESRKVGGDLRIRPQEEGTHLELVVPFRPRTTEIGRRR
jgi:hypothetical protein